MSGHFTTRAGALVVGGGRAFCAGAGFLDGFGSGGGVGIDEGDAVDEADMEGFAVMVIVGVPDVTE